MQGAEVTADLVSPLYDESLSAPSAQPNVTIQGSHKDMTNLFQFKSWRHRFEPATVLLNTNLDQQKTADVTQPKGSAADKHKFFDGSSSSESDSIDDPLHPGEAEQSLVDGLAIKESEMEQWAQSNPQMSRLYKGMTRSRGQHLAAQKDRMCTASRVHLEGWQISAQDWPAIRSAFARHSRHGASQGFTLHPDRVTGTEWPQVSSDTSVRGVPQILIVWHQHTRRSPRQPVTAVRTFAQRWR